VRVSEKMKKCACLINSAFISCPQFSKAVLMMGVGRSLIYYCWVFFHFFSLNTKYILGSSVVYNNSNNNNNNDEVTALFVAGLEGKTSTRTTP
jgi:hypothetical protein